MIATDRFWGLGPDPRVVCAATASVGRWVTVQPHDLGLPAPGTATLPELRPVSGEPVVSATAPDGSVVALAARRADGIVELAFDSDRAVEALIWRRALTPGRPLAARMPFNYRRVPAPVRRILRDLLTRRQASRLQDSDAFPAWPGDASVEAVRRIHLRARQAADATVMAAPLWPDARRYALALTHDVDSGGGLRVAAEMAEEETARGLRAGWYVVGREYHLDGDLMGRLRAGGGEIGLHDARHDNQIAFLEPAEMAARLDACRADIERFAIRGFRSPSMLRTAPLYEVLAGRFAYDSSIPDAGLLPARNGCATVFPFTRGSLPILPLTLPPDGQLLGRGLDGAGVIAAWVAKAHWVAELGGAAVHLSHPEPGFSADPEMRAAHRDFLDWVAEEARGDAWHATPGEIVEHWRARVGAPG